MSAATATPDLDTTTDTEHELDISHLDPFTVPDDGDTGDHDRFSHYVRKEDIVLATTQGVAVFALCGKKWVARRSPEKYPVCPRCTEVYESIPESGGDD